MCTGVIVVLLIKSFKLLNLEFGHLANYIDMHLYLRISGWTTIYEFSFMDENEISVLFRLILWVSSKNHN